MEKEGTAVYRQTKIFFLILVLVFSIETRSQAIVSHNDLSFDIFTQENGLPNNLIQCIYQDSKGWIWIGTSQGLSRFDGYSFVNFLPDPEDTTSIKGNLVRVIKEDSRGNLLVGTENGGLNVFDREKERFSHPCDAYPGTNFRHISVNDIVVDDDGKTYVGTEFNILIYGEDGKVLPLEPIQTDGTIFNGQFVRTMEFDDKGRLWVGTNQGLYLYSPQSNQIEYFSLSAEISQGQEIWELFYDGEGVLWVGTYSEGLFLISTNTLDIEPVSLHPQIDRAETVRSVSKSTFGEFWIGTRGGLYVYSKQKGVTGLFRHNERDSRSLSNHSILSVFHDAMGETWIGTRHGLNLLAKSKQVFHHFGALPGDDNYLNSNIIYAFWIDHEGNIWIGTEDGGINIYNPVTGRYRYLLAGEKGNYISQNCIKAFHDDGQGNLWVGTYLGGIDVINLATGKISHFRHHPDDKRSVSDNRVWDFCPDGDLGIWIATSRGVDRYDFRTKIFEHFPQLNGDGQVSWIEKDSQGNIWIGGLDELICFNPRSNVIKRFPEHTRSMYEDSRNRIWIATMDKGIALYDAGPGALKYYSEKDGLSNNQALCILEDSSHNLWISTNNGLSRFHVDKGYFRNFTSRDGLSNNQFCYGAAYKTASGQMLFGTVSGFNMFDPAEVVAEEKDVPIVLTDLRIFNRPVPIGNHKKEILHKSISETDRIALKYDQNVFTVEFAALNFANSGRNRYTYKLDGFDREWSEPGTNHSATYTNLNPGTYLLRIKNVLPGITDAGYEAQLNIVVLPPFWKTTWFLTLLFSFIVFLIFILVRFLMNREKIKNQLVIERVNARKLHELDMMKLKFFTNISHDIRTPLTLIIGPLEKIMKQDLSGKEIRENLQLVARNARNLNNLITQLLDFRKLESGNLKLNLTEGDLVDFIRNIVDSFKELAAEKQVSLKFHSLSKKLYTSFDPGKIERILNNLLSNAFKFTEAGGTISVTCSIVFDADDDDFASEEKERQFIEIVVRDTGRGIHDRHLNKIFQRFFQAGDEANDSGTGIGLALVRELVKLHKGKIFVTSKPGKGTRFTIRLPHYLSAVDKHPEETPDGFSIP
jgi:signal transduction histidine kinase/ligand-binding sensor domain-containing protein